MPSTVSIADKYVVLALWSFFKYENVNCGIAVLLLQLLNWSSVEQLC